MTVSKYPHVECSTAAVPASTPDYALATAFFDHLRRAQPSGIHIHYNSATRHFLLWLHQRRIPLADIDNTIVDRFQLHRCHCSRYSARELTTSDYGSRVRRFIRFLEDRGDIPVVDDIEDIASHIREFGYYLAAVGHNRSMQRQYQAEAEHLAGWLRLSRIQWREVDKNTLERFAQHDCHCPTRVGRRILPAGVGPARRRRGARRFINFLLSRKVIPMTRLFCKPVEDPNLSAFRIWLSRGRGATNETIRRYVKEVSRWMTSLGDPANITAAAIRDVVLDQGPQRSRASVRMTATVLRSYLRFLATRGKCRPELVHAVPWAPRRYLATLPRYASPAVIERIIAACDATTSIGLRDQAIILLLARLGLRAGDIWRLRLGDINWASAQLRLDGKNRQVTCLPLPQDAGDAVLAYLERARPSVREERIFLRIQAPFRPFASSSEIAEIVARAVGRSGIDGIPTGAHIFRHSLATTMLRQGASLESVGTVLRHRSQSTTAIYAKVDVAMLGTVAQPWPGDASC